MPNVPHGNTRGFESEHCGFQGIPFEVIVEHFQRPWHSLGELSVKLCPGRRSRGCLCSVLKAFGADH
jgi:hypothetical protein